MTTGTQVHCTVKNCVNNNNGVCKLKDLHIIREKWDEIPIETCKDADYIMYPRRIKHGY